MHRENTPFRWNIAKREQLGRLLKREEADLDSHWVDMDWILAEARATSAKVLARAEGSDLVFVGRSVENLFDYLSGAFHDLEATPRLTWFAFSGTLVPGLTIGNLGDFRPLLEYLKTIQLDPRSIASAPRPVRFVDVVASGDTFGIIAEVLKFAAHVQGVDWKAVQRRIGFIGLTCRSKNSPNTWRWQQQRAWVKTLKKRKIVNISLHPYYFAHIANYQPKATRTHSWLPEHSATNAIDRKKVGAGLAIACAMFDAGRNKGERDALASEISALPEMRHPYARAVVARLRAR